jgi:hypothetical protein
MKFDQDVKELQTALVPLQLRSDWYKLASALTPMLEAMNIIGSIRKVALKHDDPNFLGFVDKTRKPHGWCQ